MTTVTKSTKTISSKDITRKWHIVDLKGKILGRELTAISNLLQGKSKVTYSPNMDMGDFVVVINASKVEISGNKANAKVYTYYSGYPGGLREVTFAKLKVSKPQEIVRHAVSGMLPKNKLRDVRLARLHIYAGPENPHTVQFESSTGK